MLFGAIILVVINEGLGEAGLTEPMLTHSEDPVVVINEDAVVETPIDGLDSSNHIQIHQLSFTARSIEVF